LLTQAVYDGLPAVLEDAENQLTSFGGELFRSFYQELAQLEGRIAGADAQIQAAFRSNPDCQRIAAVEGVGPLIATAIVAAISTVQCAGMWDTLPKIEMSDGTEMIPELLRHLDGSTSGKPLLQTQGVGRDVERGQPYENNHLREIRGVAPKAL
jgi:hypothetical protein